MYAEEINFRRVGEVAAEPFIRSSAPTPLGLCPRPLSAPPTTSGTAPAQTSYQRFALDHLLEDYRSSDHIS